MEIQRDIYNELVVWKNKPNRKPLLLQGARQVGKTWVLKQFGSLEFQKVAYFNFDENTDLNDFFKASKDPNRILENLSFVIGFAITPHDTLIIFDEIQESNDALNALKYFNENAPDYAVISSGSLLGVALSRGKSFPVGQVEFLTMNPLSFSEFLRFTDVKLFEYIDGLTEISPFPDYFFNMLKEKLRLYFVTGGMPEVVKTLSENADYQLISEIQKNILKAYSLDFSKHIENNEVAKINFIWNSIPSQLSKENKKFLFQVVKSGARAREYENSLTWLKQAGLIHIVHRITKPEIPISSYSDLTAFKVYLLDIGLLRQLSNIHPAIIQFGDSLFTEFKGAFAENFILQSLVKQFDTIPYYWSSGNLAEVDFILQMENDIIPIEVKAETNIKSKSLLSYSQKYNPNIKIRYSLRNLQVDNNLINIPLFLVDFTEKILKLVAK